MNAFFWLFVIICILTF